MPYFCNRADTEKVFSVVSSKQFLLNKYPQNYNLKKAAFHS